MRIFSKKEESSNLSLPKLPELPNLPSEFPKIDEDYSENEIHGLPSFPNSSMGDRFSQQTIKNAISGNYEDNDDDEEMHQPVIPKPTFRNIPKPTFNNSKKEIISTKNFEEKPEREKGPVFIRIDKFEEALEVFKKTKEKIDEIEKLLSETSELKEKEEEELSKWEKEIQEMKSQIEKVDKDIFSKI